MESKFSQIKVNTVRFNPACDMHKQVAVETLLQKPIHGQRKVCGWGGEGLAVINNVFFSMLKIHRKINNFTD